MSLHLFRLLWRRTSRATTTTTITTSRGAGNTEHHHVLLHPHHQHQPSHHHHHPNCLLRRLLFTTTTTTTTSASSQSSPFLPEKSLPDTFEHMVARHKQAAACSLVLEDRSKGAFVWHRPEAEIIARLLSCARDDQPLQPVKIYRWRVGSRDGKQKRFLLLQFPSISSLKVGVQALEQRHRLPLYDRIGFLKDHHIEDWRRAAVSSSRVQVLNELQPAVETLYQIVFDNDGSSSPQQQLAPITFEDYNPLKDVLPKSTSFLHKLLQGEELISELNYKLRFFILHQMELIIRRCSQEMVASLCHHHHQNHMLELNSLMSHFEIVPFGSEVSGFGTANSDLDLCLVYRQSGGSPPRADQASPSPTSSVVPFHRSVRLLHTVSLMLERSRKVRQVDPRVGHPGRKKSSSSSPPPVTILVHQHFTEVQRIFRAFIPIIKCRSHLLPELNIDVSVATEKNSGVAMAAYLYHCCSVGGIGASGGGGLVRPFILLLKSWARHHRIVQQAPGDWFSSFQMTMLGVAFLQSRRLVPTTEQWAAAARRAARRSERSQKITSKNQNGSEVVVTSTSSSSSPMEEEIVLLLEHFFTFMVNFDFWRHAFDLRSGRCDLAKPTANASSSSAAICCIVNPYLPQLNITKTVSEAELERFLSKCHQSLEILSKRRRMRSRGGGSSREGEGAAAPLEELFGELNDRLQSIGGY
ncbi:hypothetical protein TYRP_015625 [Tyrophagus putrescentiae]|nr:hypothetical protein TYRP_015625 [Tyrophagus putrescentiae]